METGALTVGEIVEKYKLKIIYEHLDHKVDSREIYSLGTNRGGLELSGFKSSEVSRSRRVILLSSKEGEYISSLPVEKRQDHFANILEAHIPAIFITPNFKCEEDLLSACKALKSEVPVIKAPFFTYEFIATIGIYIIERLAPSKGVHGTLVNIFGYGVLLKGESGIGKSETTLDLLKNRHLFVGDDSIDLMKINNKILGRPNPAIKNFIEIRGIGILDVTKMYGYHLILEESYIDLIIELIKINEVEWGTIDRVAAPTGEEEYFGIKIPKLIIPVTPGRNLADLIEASVISLKLRQSGMDATNYFEQNIIDSLTKK